MLPQCCVTSCGTLPIPAGTSAPAGTKSRGLRRRSRLQPPVAVAIVGPPSCNPPAPPWRLRGSHRRMPHAARETGAMTTRQDISSQTDRQVQFPLGELKCEAWRLTWEAWRLTWLDLHARLDRYSDATVPVFEELSQRDAGSRSARNAMPYGGVIVETALAVQQALRESGRPR